MENNATPLPRSYPDPNGIKDQFVTCYVHELRPHASYTRHSLSVEAFKLAALSDLGDLAFQYPLIITRDRLIIDGYGRWELAKRKSRPTLPCVEYDLPEQEALKWLIQTHRTSQGLSDFIRVELALDLEPYFQEKAALNQQAGGRGKGLSKLTVAERVNSRREVARVAHVSLGNVHKVKHILAHACSALKEAARTEEISINRADKWSHEPEAKQHEYLRLFRIERGLRRKARHLVAAELARTAPSKPDEQVIRLSDFVTLASQLATIAPERSKEFESIEVKLLDGPDCAIYVTEELIRALTPQQEELVR